MTNRKLTGNWYLKKNWLGLYEIYVEITYNIEDKVDLSLSPEIKRYVKAEKEDLLTLNIKTI